MITAILGGVILSTFSILWYLEDREGGGLYDPDPRSSYYHRKHKWLLTLILSLVMLWQF